MNAKAQVPQYELLINGKWVKPKSGKYSTILNPATEEQSFPLLEEQALFQLTC